MSKYENIIIGNGFRAMMTAYASASNDKKTLLITHSKNIGGVLSPLNWEGGSFDKGYQFFDGCDQYCKNVLENFLGKDVFTDFGYGAASVTNKKIYEYHALPYWPHMGIKFRLIAIIQTIQKLVFSNKSNYKSYYDLIKNHPNNIKKILLKACKKNFTLPAEKVSYLAEDYNPFTTFRMTLFNDFIGKFLKKNFKIFDKILAIRRHAINLENFSLYPKGKNMGYVVKLMEEKLLKMGVKILLSKNTKIEKDAGELKIKTGESSYTAKKVFLTAELDDITRFFNENISLDPCNYYVPQIFYYFKTDKLISKFQYVHGNDLNMYTNRGSNVSLYGEKTKDNKNVIIAEVPMDINSEIWKNPNIIVDKIWNELKIMKLVCDKEKMGFYQFFKIEKTFSVPLVNFDKNLQTIQGLIKTKYNGNIEMPGAGRINRYNFIRSLKGYFND